MIELGIGAVAHGGHCVARHDGRVVFVRHTLPGERVLAEVTADKGRYLLADAVRVLEPAAGRRVPPCPVSGPGRCGGCDWQHAEPARQRQLKSAVLTEQLQRLGGVDVGIDLVSVAPVGVVPAAAPEPVEGPGRRPAQSPEADGEGLGWRTRVRYAVAPDGRLGFRRHRSHEVQQVPRCVIAATQVRSAADPAADWRPAREVAVVSHADGVLVRPEPASQAAPRLRMSAAGREWLVPGDGFWQVHPGAADALIAAVRSGIEDVPGVLWDLYAGVGLFAGALAGDRPEVHAVESAAAAVACARHNLAAVPSARAYRADVARWLRDGPTSARRVSAVVLDPPRRGAGREVIAAVTASAASRLAYVACDPAALGRDVGELRRNGWRLESVVGLDLFPNTHHIEAVAVLGR